MPISFSCPRCGKKLKAPDSAVGKSSKCPGCGTTVTCPEPVLDAELVDPLGGVNPYDDIDTGEPYVPVGIAKEPAGAPAPEAGGEARRPCPMCGEMIVATAAKCRYCGEIFDPALKKARKKKKKYSEDDEDLTTGETVIAVLCSGIGCIAGLVWMIQGKPKGKKMLGISFICFILWGIVRAALMTVNPQQGGP